MKTNTQSFQVTIINMIIQWLSVKNMYLKGVSTNGESSIHSERAYE